MLFLYDWIPNFVFQIILIAGIIGTCLSAFLSLIPFIPASFHLAIKVVSVVSLCIGLIWYGVDSDEQRWKARHAVAEQKISELEKRAPVITTEIVTEYIDRVKIVKEKGENLVIRVPYYVTKEADSKCPVPAGLVRLLNSAADSRVPDPTSGTDAASDKAKTPASTASLPK